MNRIPFKKLACIIALYLIFVTLGIANESLKSTLDNKDLPNLISCEWPGAVLLEQDTDGPFCQGDYVTVEAFGFSVNGGIPANLTVSDDYTFFWDGEIEFLDDRKVRLRMNYGMDDSTLRVRYALTVDGETCYDTSFINFEINSCVYPAGLLCNQYKADTLYHGDFVRVEAFGYSVNGGIPADLEVSGDYTFSWDGYMEQIAEREVRVQMDVDRDNILTIRYDLTVNGNTRSETK